MVSKLDVAWNKLFQEYNILNEIFEKGYYQIQAADIKKYREPRLMTKFDHESQLPEIFKKNHLSILPNSRSSYVIGKFNVYEKVNYDSKLLPKKVSIPTYIESIDPDNIYSEAAALSCAYASGMIEDFLGEKITPTVFGRMSSKDFDFSITCEGGETFQFDVSKSQIEIDGGYESENYFMIIEAKNNTVDDFLVRQLYYPYRLWKSKMQKEIVPVFFTYSNDIFSFFKYHFTDPENYNSLELIEQKDYILNSTKISNDDLNYLLKTVQVMPEPKVPFIQANSIERVIDILHILVLNDLTKEQVTQNYGFDPRQSDYYFNAARYLGLVEKYTKSNEGKYYRLTTKGLQIMNSNSRNKYLGIVASILEHEVFNKVIKKMKKTYVISIEEIVEIMRASDLYNIDSLSTLERRASSVKRWSEWVLKIPKIY